MRKLSLSLLLMLAVALFASACGGPDDPDQALTEACERQLEEIAEAEEESGTPAGKSSEERLEEVTLVECAGQRVRVVADDGSEGGEGEVGPAEGEGDDGTGDEGDEPAEGGPDAGGEDPTMVELDPASRDLFAQTCGACHALGDAGTTGAVGPNLDETEDDAETIEQQIINGGGGMPPALLQGEEATKVAEYVAGAAAQAQAG